MFFIYNSGRHSLEESGYRDQTTIHRVDPESKPLEGDGTCF